MNKEEAKDLYLEHCHTPKVYGGIKELTIDEFRKYLDKQSNVKSQN